MFSRSIHQNFVIALMVCFILATGIALPAADAAVNFAGKRVTIIVPFSPGGGSDTLSRYLSPFFQKYLPGNPAIIVRNVPGAGSIKGSNMIEEVKKDGLTILCASSSTMMNVIFQDKRIKFDVNKWIPILNAPMGNVIYARTDLGLTGDPVKDLKMLKETQKQVVFGGNSPTSGEFPGCWP
jgi:tripartite-type tricarboxylate transporter receptor subunit TctC